MEKMLKNFFEMIPALHIPRFYIFTLLWLSAVITSLPFFSTDFFLSDDEIQALSLTRWFAVNEGKIMTWSVAYFVLLFVILVFTIISALANRFYRYTLRDLLEEMSAAGGYFVLLMHLLHNFKITSYGFMEISEYYFLLCAKNKFFVIALFGYLPMLFSEWLDILKYFTPSTSSTKPFILKPMYEKIMQACRNKIKKDTQ